MLPASAGGNRVPVIAKLVQADEDTVRHVIHRFNEIGPACLDPRRAGGRPRLLSPDDEDFVVRTATTRPGKPGHPFTCRPVRKLAAYLRRRNATTRHRSLNDPTNPRDHSTGEQGFTGQARRERSGVTGRAWPVARAPGSG